uniref:Uncharacterized protein n=1 Tax=Chrysemys picta bellii TaxID=8478 RepID=A0A8C3F374_CHRPI
MSFAELLDHVGGTGHFQIIYAILLALPVFMLASHNLLQNFTAATSEHHCHVHININNTPYTNLTGKLAAKDLLRVSIPMDSNLQPENCHRFVTMQWQLLDSNATITNLTKLETEPCADGWVYDKSIFTNTILTEWDLMYDSRQLKQMAQSIYMAGILVGDIVFGGLSDRFGRKSLLIWCYLQMPSFTAYCIFCFLTGMAFSGIMMNGVSLSVEWTPTRTWAVVVTMFGYCITIWQCILAGVAYAIPNWRWLQLVVSLWFAESACWLVLAGKADRAVKVLQRVLRVNGKWEEGEKITTEVKRPNGSSYNISDLVRTPTIRRIFCCLSIVWFSTSFSYYGLAIELQNLGVSIYLLQLIFGAVDFPAKVVVTISMSYIGCRVTLSAFVLLAGLVIIAKIFVPRDLQIVRTSLAVIGKGCLSAAFNCEFLFTTELYPTPITTMARVGGIVAPLAKMLDEYFSFLPPVVYGAAPIISGTVATFVPETLNQPLPDTVEEVESRSCMKRGEDPKEKIPLQNQEKVLHKETC